MRSVAFLGLLTLALGASLVACGSRDGDQPVDAQPNPIGTGLHIRDVVDPSKNMANQNVTVSGAVVLTTDTYDETSDGKSRGTVYVQDIGSQAPYSGVSLYSPTFVPSSLRAVPGDTLDLVGQFVTVSSIGTAIFDPGEVLPQISKPTASFRYEYQTPDPLVVDIADFDDYATGYKWENMLVTVKGVVLCDGLSNSKGRITGTLGTDCQNSTGGVSMSNELMPLDASKYGPGSRFVTLTGVVTWFFSFHIAPRSQDDIVQ